MKILPLAAVFAAVALPHSIWAHQPVMDMAPRWSGGWGLQLRQVWYGSDEYLAGSREQVNPLGLERYALQTWLEGVYTFDRSRRVTFKMPYLDKERTTLAGRQKTSGWGDLVLAAPLKKYRNRERYTDNFGFTPQIRLPTGSTSGSYPASDGSLDFGLSLSYSGEGYLFEALPELNFYHLYDIFYWQNREGKGDLEEGDELGLDVNLGFKLFHDNDSNSGAFVMWDLTARRQKAGDALTGAYAGKSVHTGPVFVWYKDALMLRAEWKMPAYEEREGTGLARGDLFEFGLGISF
jgi:hypothetical protein